MTEQFSFPEIPMDPKEDPTNLLDEYERIINPDDEAWDEKYYSTYFD